MKTKLFDGRVKVLSASILLSSLFFVPQAQASLSDELQNMFEFANTTTAGSFQTALRSGWGGGGVAIRGPIKNINIVSFDPPRLTAGCGGIDMFGGSFSFINSDQLIALFRSIAQNAVGVAFKAAIDAINPLLGRIMQDFQALVQALNLGNANTCAIASSIVNSSASLAGLDLTTRSATTGEKTALGSFADNLASYTKGWFTNSQDLTKEAAADDRYTEVGNWTWKALGRSGAVNTLPNPITGENNPKANKEFLMSVLGTWIIGTEPNTSSTTTDGRSAAPSVGIYPPLIDLSILKTGPQRQINQTIKMYRCGELPGSVPVTPVPDGACDKITQAEVGNDFHGVIGYVNNMFFGQPNGMAGGTAPGSIIEKVLTCTDVVGGSCGMTAQQTQFLTSLRGPVVSLLAATTRDRRLVEKVMDDLAPIIANEYYAMYLDLFEEAARLAYSGEGQQQPPQFANDVVAQLQTLRLDARKDNEEHVRKMNEVVQYVRDGLGMIDAPQPFAVR